MVADRFIPAYERPFLVIKNGHFAPYGQILKIRFSAIKYRILDFLSDSSRGRYPLSIPHMFRGGKKVKRCEFFDAVKKRSDGEVCGDSASSGGMALGQL